VYHRERLDRELLQPGCVPNYSPVYAINSFFQISSIHTQLQNPVERIKRPFTPWIGDRKSDCVWGSRKLHKLLMKSAGTAYTWIYASLSSAKSSRITGKAGRREGMSCNSPQCLVPTLLKTQGTRDKRYAEHPLPLPYIPDYFFSRLMSRNDPRKYKRLGEKPEE
jgi:hypothetical protein